MEIISIEKKDTYTELTKYYRYSIEKFKEVFKQRHLDWDYFLNKAEKAASNSSGMWTFYTTDVLTDDLRNYDTCIRNFYNKCMDDGLSIEDIYLKFAENKKELEYLHIKIK